ncbi:MAG TPA: YciI family protein, partial [Microbacterium sp.]|nr:YciI family protein [Microbacterium sp.]
DRSMRYTLLLHYAEQAEESLGAEAMEEGMRAFAAYAAALHGARVLIAAEVLRPSESTTTVSMDDGVLRVQDGPFADTKEQLGGTFVIDVPDLDEAISWASQAPAVQWGAVEIRPGATHTRDGVWVANG